MSAATVAETTALQGFPTFHESGTERAYDRLIVTNAKRLLLAGVITGISDALFATTQSVLTSNSFTRVWKGVASTILGPSAVSSGGPGVAAIGLAMHFCVAFFWSGVFLFGVSRLDLVQRALGTRSGVVTTAMIYGPLIWMAMSLGVIPLLVHKPPSITPRWWLQFFGHMLFVALPIVTMTAAARAEAPATFATAAR